MSVHSSTSSRVIRPRWGRITIVLGALVVTAVLVLGACGLYYASALNDRLDRTDAFAGLRGDRPPASVDGALNVLVIGSDERMPGEQEGVEGARADALMLLHLSGDHDKAYNISIPRDSWVRVPKYKNVGGEEAKINAAYAWGGTPLTVKTVERLTSIKIDHVIVVDFGGFTRMTDALGGVDVLVDETTFDPRSSRTFQAGWNRLDGAAALDYVRQRYNLPRGDFDRMQRQQIFLRALMQKATESGTLKNPGKLKNFLDAAADSMTVNKEFSLVDLALEFRNIRMENVFFITMPISDMDIVDGQSVVHLDEKKSTALFRAVSSGKTDKWFKENPPNNVENGH